MVFITAAIDVRSLQLAHISLLLEVIDSTQLDSIWFMRAEHAMAWDAIVCRVISVECRAVHNDSLCCTWKMRWRWRSPLSWSLHLRTSPSPSLRSQQQWQCCHLVLLLLISAWVPCACHKTENEAHASRSEKRRKEVRRGEEEAGQWVKSQINEIAMW